MKKIMIALFSLVTGCAGISDSLTTISSLDGSGYDDEYQERIKAVGFAHFVQQQFRQQSLSTPTFSAPNLDFNIPGGSTVFPGNFSAPAVRSLPPAGGFGSFVGGY